MLSQMDLSRGKGAMPPSPLQQGYNIFLKKQLFYETPYRFWGALPLHPCLSDLLFIFYAPPSKS